MRVAIEENDNCRICELPKHYHIPDNVNHEFSTDGQLRPLKKTEAPTPGRANVVLGRLIGMLSNKGILTPDEVASLVTGESDASHGS